MSNHLDHLQFKDKQAGVVVVVAGVSIERTSFVEIVSVVVDGVTLIVVEVIGIVDKGVVEVPDVVEPIGVVLAVVGDTVMLVKLSAVGPVVGGIVVTVFVGGSRFVVLFDFKSSGVVLAVVGDTVTLVKLSGVDPIVV